MKKNTLFFASLLSMLFAYGQTSRENETQKAIYRLAPERINDLVHTKLDVKFDYAKAYLYGKAWITLRPHFYATDSLRLDAKGMNIDEVAILQNGKSKALVFDYSDSLNLKIKLDRLYKASEPYTIYIKYTAKPNEFNAQGSAAITDAKGLYFINPTGEDKNKPTQIWTKGETEASSVWFPTIDRTNQKTTQEILMTVPARYVTLSNGKLISQKKNIDGTRTDYWKMDLPHSPYLFFMGVGDFAIVKDTYKGKEVNYYVEKPYEKVARRIFGNTPEMMSFFSKKLGVEYPWVKYSQMTGRDYVSGAMENTTATLHTDALQQNARELSDGNRFEDYVSHELFHQWFGDLVTAESWSNLTVNESFANFSEVLWNEYKYGKDAGDHHNYTDLLTYLNSRSETKDLVRFNYKSQEDMFDAVSYHKGGRILNMLRHYVGEDAFFKALNLYLTRHKFKNAEAHELRLIFEEVTGKDLTWFWNQWYFGSGHPKLDVSYGYDEASKMATVSINQTQGDKLFKLPVAIDIYTGKTKTRHTVWLENKTDSFSFPVSAKPELINFDGEKILLVEKKENKTIYNYIHQYDNAKTYVHRREAIDYAVRRKDQAEAKTFLLNALNDPYFELRERVLKSLRPADLDKASVSTIEAIARKDAKRTTRAAAIDLLGTLNNVTYTDLFLTGTKDSSYSVAGASLIALSSVDEAKAIGLLPELQKDAKGRLKTAIELVQVLTKGEADFDEMTKKFDEGSIVKKINEYRAYVTFLAKVNNTENFKKGIDKVIAFRDVLGSFNPAAKETVNGHLKNLQQKKASLRTSSNADAIDAQIKYIEEKIK
ncbi:MAG: aminopeptidase [Segetibacter sp.]|nr:aminopeptidase [Segetibacter sp.]